MTETAFDPSAKVPGFNFTYGDINLGGDCWWGMPAVYRMSTREIKLGPEDDHHPQTEELYEKYGATLPDVYEVDELVDVEIGCANYQALVAAGVAVEACVGCPLLQNESRNTS